MNCPICDSEFVRRLYDYNDMRWDCWNVRKYIYECSLCKLRFLYPQWSQEELNKLYREYHLGQLDFEGQEQAPRITKYLDDYMGEASCILEIGSGRGHNIRRLNNKYPGKMFRGIDKDPDVCDGILTHNVDFEDYEPTFRHHFIYAIQVFEHVAHPLNFIKKIMDLLIVGGYFLLEIPNSDDPLLTLYKVKNFTKFYNIPYHLFFYNEKNIHTLFEQIGVKIRTKRHQNYGIINHLRWIIYGVPGNWNPHIPIIDDIYKFILTKIFKISDTLIILGEK